MLVSRFTYVLLLLPGLVACTGGESNKDPLFEAKFQNEKRIGEAAVTKRQIRDAEFVVETVSRKMQLLEISQLAQRKAASADARYTAQNVAAQVTILLTELKTLAQQKTLTLPTGLGETQAQEVGELTALNGAAFDQQYAELTAKVLDTDEDTTDDMADDAYDPDIRALAARQLPALKALGQATEVLHDKLKP